MSYVALYRKFRPSAFGEVRGQEQVVIPLRNQIRSGNYQHAYLFAGTRGTGKTSVAKIFAKALNCEHPSDGEPCGECDSCRRISEGNSMNVIEIDAASNNGVDNIRELIEEAQYRPPYGTYKVYIIDEVHMLTVPAFNALLKTLEEPPEYVKFILATTEPGRIPVTILSRCQRYDFKRIGSEVIADRMREITSAEGLRAEDDALAFIARAADGSLRDALSLLDRCLAMSSGETLTYEKALKALGESDITVFTALTDAVLKGDARRALGIFAKEAADGADAGQFISEYTAYLRDLMMVAAAGISGARDLVDLADDQITALADTASGTDIDTIIRFIRILSDLTGQMRYASNRRVLAEVALLKMAAPSTDRSGDALTGRLDELERRLDSITSGEIAIAAPRAEEMIPMAEPEDEERAEVLPEAAPEDLKRICGEWNHFISRIEGEGVLKSCLLERARPQFSERLDNTLYIEFRGMGDKDPAVRLIMDSKEEHREKIKGFIRKQYGIDVDVELHLKKERREDLVNVDVDRMYDAIHAEVEVADFPDDEF